MKQSIIGLALLLLPAVLVAQSSRGRFEFETVGGLQVMSSVPQTGLITGLYRSGWDDVIPRFGARAAVRPLRRVSRLLVEVMGTIAPQRAPEATALLLLPPSMGEVLLVTREPRVGLGDGRGPMASLRVGFSVVQRSRGDLTLVAGAGAMRGLGRPLALAGASGSVDLGAARLTAGAEWMGANVPLDIVSTVQSRGVTISRSTTATTERISGALFRVGVQWRIGE
jgi:hypothetical protein